MPIQCPNCVTDGYCQLQNCKLAHSPDCSKGSLCTKPDCVFMHPTLKCFDYKKCKLYECKLRHGKSRDWKCGDAEHCDNKSCKLLHPISASSKPPSASAALSTPPPSTPNKTDFKISGSFPNGISSVSDSMSSAKSHKKAASTPTTASTHPPHHAPSRPSCPLGDRCTSSLCMRVHPPRPLEKALLQEPPPGMCGHFMSVQAARNAHMIKLEAVATEAFRLLQKEPEQHPEKRQEQVAILEAVQAQALELSQQLNNFDLAVLQCVDTARSVIVEDVKEAKKRIKREIYRLKLALPALSMRHDIEQSVRGSQFVVIQGATGSG